MLTKRQKVNCDGCTRCCQGFQQIMLQPEDNPDRYHTTPSVCALTGNPGLMVQQKPNGDCIYLGTDGCTIYSDAPAICRKFDCRAMAATIQSQTTRPEFRRVLRADKSGVLKHGHQLSKGSP